MICDTALASLTWVPTMVMGGVDPRVAQTTRTTWPRSVSSAAVVRPEYPAPITVTMAANAGWCLVVRPFFSFFLFFFR